MITATATGEHGERIVVLGVTRGNVERLVSGKPIRVSAETHSGFPENLVIYITFGETERALVAQMQPFISTETKVIAVPRDKGDPS